MSTVQCSNRTVSTLLCYVMLCYVCVQQQLPQLSIEPEYPQVRSWNPSLLCALIWEKIIYNIRGSYPAQPQANLRPLSTEEPQWSWLGSWAFFLVTSRFVLDWGLTCQSSAQKLTLYWLLLFLLLVIYNLVLVLFHYMNNIWQMMWSSSVHLCHLFHE